MKTCQRWPVLCNVLARDGRATGLLMACNNAIFWICAEIRAVDLTGPEGVGSDLHNRWGACSRLRGAIASTHRT